MPSRTQYRIVGGKSDYGFVHINLLFREGCPLEIQKEAMRRVMAVLKDKFGDLFEMGKISLSIDLKEMQEGNALTDHNITTE